MGEGTARQWCRIFRVGWTSVHSEEKSTVGYLLWVTILVKVLTKKCELSCEFPQICWHYLKTEIGIVLVVAWNIAILLLHCLMALCQAGVKRYLTKDILHFSNNEKRLHMSVWLSMLINALKWAYIHKQSCLLIRFEGGGGEHLECGTHSFIKWHSIHHGGSSAKAFETT
jgi:hypothetical protein